MAKNKGTRIIITLKCTECGKRLDTNQRVNRGSKQIMYTTTKNRRNTPDRLEVKKFCPNCNSHTLHREIK